MEVIDFYEWDRALESVGRGLKRLIVPDESAMVTITDCHSWTSVTKFLHSDINYTEALQASKPGIIL
jgi:hypothetical protein